MKVCQPVEKDQGIDNVLHGHFRSAPRFVIVDTDTHETFTFGNTYEDEDHDITKPLESFSDIHVDVAIVGGVGRCDLKKLQSYGIKVFQAAAPALEANLEALQRGELAELTMKNAHRGHLC